MQLLNQGEYKLYDHIKLIMGDEHKEEQKLLLNSSKGQDVVLLLGITGSGKSSLMNLLINKELFINDNEEIELKNPNDPSAMKIGFGGESETSIPKFAQVGSLTFYDLPGFNDNRGTATNLVNASFIKSIMESAKSVRLIFVAGQDELTASRGQSFKSLMKTMSVLLPGTNAIKNSSSLVITKSINTNSYDLIDYLKLKIQKVDQMSFLLDPDRIQPMSKKIDEIQKNDLIRKIEDTNPSKIEYVNIEAIYNADVTNDLRQIFELEMSSSLDKIYNNQPKNLSSVEEIDKAKLYLQDSFQNDILSDLENSTIIELLKPISQNIFKEEQSKFQNNVKEKIDLSLVLLNLKHQKLVNEEQKKKSEKELVILTNQVENMTVVHKKFDEKNKRDQKQAVEQHHEKEIQMNLLKQECIKMEKDQQVQKIESEKKSTQQKIQILLNKEASIELEKNMQIQKIDSEQKLTQQNILMMKLEDEMHENDISQQKHWADQELLQENQAKEVRLLNDAIMRQQEELIQLQKENELNKEENWPVKIESKTDYQILWGFCYYGQPKSYGWFLNGGTKTPMFEKQIKVTVVSERTVRVQPKTGFVIVDKEWKQVSKTQITTGEEKFIGYYRT